MIRSCRGRILLFILCCLAAAALLCVSAAAEEARDIAKDCHYQICKGSFRKTQKLYDGDYSEWWESASRTDPWLEVTLPEGQTCTGVQIKWHTINPGWCVEVEDGNGGWVSAGGYDGDYLHTWTPLDHVTKFRVAAHTKRARTMRILEMQVYSEGDLPDSVQIWQPTVEKADLLVVVAHPDDEYVFLGAVIPYYAGERKMDVLVSYVTESSFERRAELLDGLWTAGVRTYPLIGRFHDRFTFDLNEAYRRDGKNKHQNYMIEVFRHYKPDVVVTHDINGEYGHGMHKLSADVVINALKKSGSSKYHKESAKAYGTWEVPKCYIHLYGKDQIRFDWNAMTLDAFGGKTAFEVADAAWQCHTSQFKKGKYEVYIEGPYDSQIFGLYRSKAGPDREHNDFFENLPKKGTIVEE